jgi:hypothetical protein
MSQTPGRKQMAGVRAPPKLRRNRPDKSEATKDILDGFP